MGFAGGKENFFAKKLFFPSCTSQSFKKLLNNAFIFLLCKNLKAKISV